MPEIIPVGAAGAVTGSNVQKQEKNIAGLFSTLLLSMMSDSTSSIGDFSEQGNGLYDSGSIFGSSLGTGLQGSSETMANAFLILLLLSNQGGSSLISSLLGDSSSGSPELPSASEPDSGLGYSSGTGSGVALSYINQYQNASQLNAIPSSSWVPVNPPVVSRIGERNANTYRSVIDQFNVETNERYRVNKLGQNETYCNIFAWDVSRAMGAEIPHYINSQTGEPLQSLKGANAKELNANDTNDWLNKYGSQYGWVRVTPEEAQNYANKGMPAITSWKNPNGHGHMQVVSPSANGKYDPVRGVAIAQAGRNNYNYNYASAAYGPENFDKVEYFVHI